MFTGERPPKGRSSALIGIVRGATTSPLADGTGLHNVTSTMAGDRLSWLEIG